MTKTSTRTQGKGPVNIKNDMQSLENHMFCDKSSPNYKFSETSIDRFKYEIDMYQEQANIIESHINKFVNKLLIEVKKEQDQDKSDSDRVTAVYTYFYYLVKLMGPKKCLRFLPHQVEDLDWALKNLENDFLAIEKAEFLKESESKSKSKNVIEINPIGTWQRQYCWLLCLSVTVSIPFHLSKFDKFPDKNGRMLTVEKMLNIGKKLISSQTKSSPTASIAVLMLGKLFSRADVQDKYFDDFIKELIELSNDYLFNRDNQKEEMSQRELEREKFDRVMGAPKAKMMNPKTMMVLANYMKILCNVIKSSKREDILRLLSADANQNLSYFEKIMGFILNIMQEDLSENDQNNSNSGSRSSIDTNIRHLCVKLAQRLALLYLPNRIVTWRYKRGKRSLNQTLGDSNTNSLDENKSKDLENMQKSFEKYFWCPDFIEEILDLLLQNLTASEQKVRWSAAKGLGRISSRLPASYNCDLIPPIMDQVKTAENSIDQTSLAKTYQGASLAVAELARRGLITVEELSSLGIIKMLVEKVLLFDDKNNAGAFSGKVSVSSQAVRDSGCYVCWAIARAYNKEDIKSFEKMLAISLLMTATVDREVTCRKAAAAAFQEYVGRQGAFPNGIDIVTQVDMTTVALLSRSVTELAPWVVSLNPEIYQNGFLRHILQNKLGHWDEEIREFSAIAFSKILATQPIESNQAKEIIEDLVNKALNNGSTWYAPWDYVNNCEMKNKKYKFKYSFEDQHGALLTLNNLIKSRQVDNDGFELLGQFFDEDGDFYKTSRYNSDLGAHLRIVTFEMFRNLLINYPEQLNSSNFSSIKKIIFEALSYFKKAPVTKINSYSIVQANVPTLRQKMSDIMVEVMALLEQLTQNNNMQSSGQSFIIIEEIFKLICSNSLNDGTGYAQACLYLILSQKRDLNHTEIKKIFEFLKEKICHYKDEEKYDVLARKAALKTYSKIYFSNLDQITSETDHQSEEQFYSTLIQALNDNTSRDHGQWGLYGDIGHYVRKQAIDIIGEHKLLDPIFYPHLVKELGCSLAVIRESTVATIGKLKAVTLKNDNEFEWAQPINILNEISTNEEDCLHLLATHYIKQPYKNQSLKKACLEVLLINHSQFQSVQHLTPKLENSQLGNSYELDVLTKSLMKRGRDSLFVAIKSLINDDLAQLISEILEDKIENNENYLLYVRKILSGLEKMFLRGFLIDDENLIKKLRGYAANKSKNNKKIQILTMPAINCLSVCLNQRIITPTENYDDLTLLLLKKFCLLLVHHNPQVRILASEKIRESLMFIDFGNKNQQLTEVLENTDWAGIGQAAKVKAAKTSVVELLEIS